ncbi:MAG: TonB-dependent receptor plug domain-containing protein [Longimicrobiales bacterium]|nr:TonB-dependent receptor plug domain-containing protein [Longimicrobiales bacterium]
MRGPKGSRLRASLPAAALLLVLPCLVSAQTIRGQLLEFGSDTPIDLGLVVMVSLDGDSVSAALSDGRGFFEVTAEDPGEYLLEASAFGYEPTRVGLFELGDGGEMSVEFRLWAAPLTLDGVVVESLVQEPVLVRNGFYRRMGRGVGTFFSPQDIETSNARRAIDMIQGLAGVRMRIDPVHGERLMVRGAQGYCVPTLLIDGVRATWEGTSMRLDELIPLETVYAMEVHRGVSGLPIEFGSFERCGVIVFWTKRDPRDGGGRS